MYRTLQSIQRKPEHERRRYVIWLSAGSTLLIALIWVTTLFGGSNNNSATEVVRREVPAEAQVAVVAKSPLIVIKESLSNSAEFAWQQLAAAINFKGDRNDVRVIESNQSTAAKAPVFEVSKTSNSKAADFEFLPESKLEFLP